jgi:hypothetical protein
MAGEPVHSVATLSSGVSSANTHVLAAADTPVIGTHRFGGVALENSENASAGTVLEQFLTCACPVPAVGQIQGRAETAANVDTLTELALLIGDVVLIDYSATGASDGGQLYTIKDAASADTSGLEIVGGNTSDITLSGGGNFTGTWRELWKFGGLQVSVFSDVSSAVDGFKVEFSYDGLTVHYTNTYTYNASSGGIGYIFPPEFKFFRINYTNGAAAQTDFKLISTLKPTALFPSQSRITTALFDEAQVLLTKSVLSGKTSGGGGGYVDVKVNPSGHLQTNSTISGTVTTTVTGTVTTSEATRSGTITQTQATVGLTAVRATVAGTAPSATRKKLMIKPSKNNTGSIYFGASTVTTSTGMEIIGPDRLEFELDSADYYLISDTAAQVVEIIEVV